MKINFTIFSTKLTGGTRVVMEIINGLAKRGHEINLLTFGKPEDLSWIDLRANVIYANRSFVEKVFGFLFRKAFGFQCFPEEETRQILKLMPDCDINVATISYSAYAVSRSKKGIPFHYYMHYEPLVREEEYKKRIIEESYFLPTKKIVNSSWLADMIKKNTEQDIAGLVFPAINHNIFYPRKRKKKEISKKKIKIVSLAKYKRWKGLPEGLKAIEIVRNKGYEIEFLTFGSVFSKDMLSRDVKNIEFTFVGPKVDDSLAEFYSEADILISSSYFESFPLPPIEAMACGTPVVTTIYGTEDYAFDHKNALVVEPKKPKQMADAIIELIENKNLYNKIREEGIKTAKKFTWDNATKQIENIFKEAIKNA